MKKQKLSREDQKALSELISQQTTRVGTRRSENKGFTDTPLFLPKNQNEIFVEPSKKALFVLKREMRIETVQDYIAANVHSGKVNIASWNRFGDRNDSQDAGFRLNWLRKTGPKLDIVALEMSEEFATRDESELLESIVEFMRQYPHANDVRAYIEKRLMEQKTQTMPSQRGDGKASQQEIACFVDKAKKALPANVLRRETAIYLKAPKSYFGALYEIPDCSEDIFSLPDAESRKVVLAIRKSVQSSSTPKRSATMKTAKTTRSKTAAKKKNATKRKTTAKKPIMARLKHRPRKRKPSQRSR